MTHQVDCHRITLLCAECGYEWDVEDCDIISEDGFSSTKLKTEVCQVCGNQCCNIKQKETNDDSN